MSRTKRLLLAFSFVAGVAASHCFAEPIAAPVNADLLRTDQALGIRSQRCDHVIDLLLRTRMLRQSGQVGFGGGSYAPHLGKIAEPGDLELTCVHLIAEGCAPAGPIFQVQLQNHSDIPVGNFRVSVVAALGQIRPFSPTAVVTVPRIEAGAALQLQVQLPSSCLTLHNQAGAAVEFDTLIVAIDSYDELVECNEINNVLILNRAEITSPDMQENVGRQSAPVAAPSEQDAAAPVAPQSPIDSINLDDLELEGATPTAIVSP
ncbi:MAG: hypothetical protein ACIALR_04950 [Blastopirellula sp. JB062]